MSFVECLKYGKKKEDIAKEFFTADEIISAPNKKFSDWDFYLRYGDENTYIEVKSDRYTSKTGNICIEFESNGVASGISVTKSDYYFYMVEGEDCNYLIPVDVIKKMIEQKLYHSTRKLGYRYLSRCYLFSREVFDAYKF
jgi:hypothetical protein